VPRPRLIPVLTMDRDRRLVKTVDFGPRTYIGDPFNIVRIFNEKEVDEIIVLDIDATVDGRSPDPVFIGELAAECFMPLAYGGGITSAAQGEELSRVGVEKIILGRGAADTSLIAGLKASLGSQAVVACVDVRGSGESAHCVTSSARMSIGLTPMEFCQRLEAQGIGEIILQSVDRDGMRQGYDLGLLRSIASRVSVPVVALGGAGEAGHLEEALAAGASAAASGSAFTFIGRLRAVLVTYPDGRHLPGATMFTRKTS
jgi:imidazole glycerol-phosphate synthase subunit HisF